MGFIQDLFHKPYPSDRADEVQRLLADLVKIGKTEDFLAERFTPGFNSQMRHVGARDIGKRLNEIGGIELMEFAYRHIRRKINKNIGEHLEYCWDGVGPWKA